MYKFRNDLVMLDLLEDVWSFLMGLFGSVLKFFRMWMF